MNRDLWWEDQRAGERTDAFEMRERRYQVEVSWREDGYVETVWSSQGKDWVIHNGQGWESDRTDIQEVTRWQGEGDWEVQIERVETD